MARRSSTLDRMRREANEIFRQRLRAVDPEDAILRHVKVQDDMPWIGGRQLKLTDYDRVLVVGAGKEDAPMAKALLFAGRQAAAIQLAPVNAIRAHRPIVRLESAPAGKALDRILEKQEFIVGTSGDRPPLTAKTKEGKIIGLDADL